MNINEISWKKIVLFIFCGIFLCFGFFLMLRTANEGSKQGVEEIKTEIDNTVHGQDDNTTQGKDDNKVIIEDNATETTQNKVVENILETEKNTENVPQVELIEENKATIIEQIKTTEPTKRYASCQEAIDAGEARVQGTKGSGKGFPVALVDARDGDGDGVVCEK